ncbi:MAG: 2-dehydropantoate 2-reductase N-terminal domain-containing protein [Rhodothermales bacterium]
MTDTRVLIAGSGAVGAIYAEYLDRAGCSVTFLVRDRESSNAAMPRPLHEYRVLGGRRTVTQHVPCVTSAEGAWDQVWLCLPSTALESEWLAERLGELAPGTPVVTWTPDVRDRDRLEKMYNGANRGPIVQGVIGFLSFQSPLPGTDSTLEGFGYFLPPFAAALLEESPEGDRAAAWLRAGGLPARTRSDLAWTAARGAAVLICTVAALEHSEWSLQRLRGRDHLSVVQQAAVEAIRATASYMGRSAGLAARLPYRMILAAALRFAPLVVPIPMEAYLQYHFSKIGGQTRMMLDTWLDIAREEAMPAPGLESLRSRLGG